MAHGNRMPMLLPLMLLVFLSGHLPAYTPMPYDHRDFVDAEAVVLARVTALFRDDMGGQADGPGVKAVGHFARFEVLESYRGQDLAEGGSFAVLLGVAYRSQQDGPLRPDQVTRSGQKPYALELGGVYLLALVRQDNGIEHEWRPRSDISSIYRYQHVDDKPTLTRSTLAGFDGEVCPVPSVREWVDDRARAEAERQ